MILFGEDLLASHQSKIITPNLIQQADLILVMSSRMKVGLPKEKTYTLKEYAGDTGDIADPFGGNVDIYLKTAKEISDVVDKIIPKLLSQNIIQKDKSPNIKMSPKESIKTDTGEMEQKPWNKYPMTREEADQFPELAKDVGHSELYLDKILFEYGRNKGKL